jgi:hypothetical protein
MINYSREFITIQAVADSVKPAKGTNRHMADYLRKKLLDRNRPDSKLAMILGKMDDAELIESYHRYEEEKNAKVTITRTESARMIRR